MNGPEHYREAARLLVHTDRSVTDRFGEGAECARQQLAEAQVHATLALAAATALWPAGQPTVAMSAMTELRAWLDVCAVDPTQVVSE